MTETGASWIADLHIHSHFSRATAKNLDPENLALWSAKKGITLCGTGDLTHEGWLQELESSLIKTREGLYRFKGGEEAGVRFILSGEISCIYKQAGKTRKVHLVILMPSFRAARKFNGMLGHYGANLVSDGRPIVGLTAKQILEMVLASHPAAELIPAHIWTPWFSVLGSKSGFDSIEQCFQDLTEHVHAVETGLSSDPPMNWRVSSLDRFHLTSSSDAHSPGKLGREATLFSGPVSYENVIRALRTGENLKGTLEFFPEEGKYHLDGHRKCGVRMSPQETLANDLICPVCGKPVTVGVLHRVEELADRAEGERHDQARRFESLLSLPEIISEAVGVGPASKKVTGIYEKMLAEMGPELAILRVYPEEDIERSAGPVVAEGVRRVRAGKLTALGGFDGQFGTLKLFTPEERAEINRQGALFAVGSKPEAPPKQAAPKAQKKSDEQAPLPKIEGLRRDPDQEAAITAPAGPVLVVAGPGGGKTGVLKRRIEDLIDQGAEPSRILALTFTKKASAELAERLAGVGDGVHCSTFHALGLSILKEWGRGRPVIDEDGRLELVRELVRDHPLKPKQAVEMIGAIKLGRERIGLPVELYRAYQDELENRAVYDYEDLITLPPALAERDDELAEELASRYDHILVDEFQDLNQAQYQWLEWLAPEPDRSLTVVGDPDQSIYGFRGAGPEFFDRLAEDRPDLARFELRTSYRCPEPILEAAQAVIRANPGNHLSLRPLAEGGFRPSLIEVSTSAVEAIQIAKEIQKILGGSTHLSQAEGDLDGRQDYSLADIAILVRLHRQTGELAEALEFEGLPYQVAGDEPGREVDGLDFTAEKISLLTLHAAKGLQFPVVILAGLEDGLLPYHPPGGVTEDNEERRLFYVGLTRAEERLILTRAKKRNLFGRALSGEPSPFLQELKDGLVISKKTKKAKPKKQVQGELF